MFMVRNIKKKEDFCIPCKTSLEENHGCFRTFFQLPVFLVQRIKSPIKI